MPVPLAPYPTPSVPSTTPPPNGAQSQLVCSGCRNLLLYPQGALSVCCAVCSSVTAAPPPANQVAHVNCGNCRTLLMYQYGARSVKCAVCNFVTSIGAAPSIEQKPSS
uniref:Zinc finger LSD1-type domain-containing protein n=1 Tax=Amblyomma maculatum TaxID=34609 RepID=G3MQY9_AMBMU